MITYRFSIIKQEIDAYVLHKLSLVRASIRLLSAHTPASLPKLTKKIISQQTKAPQKDLRRDLGTRVFNEANPILLGIFLFGIIIPRRSGFSRLELSVPGLGFDLALSVPWQINLSCAYTEGAIQLSSHF